MWPLAIFLVAAIAAITIAWRRGPRGRDSVDEQHQVLDALRVAAQRRLPDPERASLPPARRDPLSRRARRRTRSPFAGRSVPVFAIGTTVLVLALVVAVVAAIGGDRGSGSGAGPDRTRSTARSTTSTSTTTTTTLPAPVVAPVAGTTGALAVTVPKAPYEIAVATDGTRCWMQAKGPDGTVVDTETLGSRDSKTLPATGPLTVRLGNRTGVTVTVDGQPLTLPTGGPSSLELRFSPAPPT